MAFEAAKMAIQENKIILVYLSIKIKNDPKSAILGVSHLALYHSNGKFVFDHRPNVVLCFKGAEVNMYTRNICDEKDIQRKGIS